MCYVIFAVSLDPFGAGKGGLELRVGDGGEGQGWGIINGSVFCEYVRVCFAVTLVLLQCNYILHGSSFHLANALFRFR